MNFRHEIARLAGAGALLSTLGITAPARAADTAKPAATQSAAGACTTDNLLAGLAPWQTAEVRGAAALVTDGAIAPEGAEWDAPVTIQLDSRRGSLTYDLGRSVAVAAFVLEADANDS